MEGKELKPLRPGATIRVPTVYEHKIRQFRILYQPACAFEVGVHNACICNEEISLRNRVLFPVPTPDRSFVSAMRVVAHRIGMWAGKFEPDVESTWIAQYYGRKKTLYQNAKVDVMEQPFRRGMDRYVKSFIKMEKVSDISKDPRMIQARSPRFNLMLGNFLKPMEHRLYQLTGTRQLRKIFPSSRLIAKCLDLRTRARILRKKFDRFSHPVVFSLDASRFDAHVSVPLLQVEHSIYQYCYNNHPFLNKLLSCQLYNKGVTTNGIRYRCPGGRMSGDMNTALGNCLLMCIIVATCMRQCGFTVKQWDMFCDGDDTIVILHRRDAVHFERMFPLQFSRAGMSMKLENRTSQFEEIRFCQGSPIMTSDGLKFVADPMRTLSRALVSTRHFQHPQSVDPLLTQIGKCELAIHLGVPVLQAFALAMLRNSRGVESSKHQPLGRWIKAHREIKAHAGKIVPVPISEESRLEFEQAFGISPLEQKRLESLFQFVVF